MDSIEQLFTTKGIYRDLNDDGFADWVNGSIYVKNNLTAGEKKVAIELSGRIGFETTALSLPLIKFADDFEWVNGDHIILDQLRCPADLDQHQAVIELEPSSGAIFLYGGSEQAFLYAGEYLYARLPYVWEIGAHALKLSHVVAAVKAATGAQQVFITNLIFDSRYDGIYCCRIVIRDCKRAEVIAYAEQLQAEKKWRFIGNVELIVDDCCVTVEGALPLRTNSKQGASACKADFLQQIDICETWTMKGLLADTDGDFSPDYTKTQIVLPQAADHDELLAASNIAAKLGLESLGLTFPLMCWEEKQAAPDKHLIVINKRAGSEPALRVQTGSISSLPDGNILVTGEGGTALQQISEFMTAKLPYLGRQYESTVKDVRDYLLKTLAGANFEGQLARFCGYLSQSLLQKGQWNCYFDGIDKDYRLANQAQQYLKAHYPETVVALHAVNEAKMLWEEEFSVPWEIDVVREVLKCQVYPKLRPGDRVSIRGIVSEEQDVRNELQQELKRNIEAHQAICENVKFFCAFKQGLSWIMEEVVPCIKAIMDDQDIGKIAIFFKPFLQHKHAVWNSKESSYGAVPNYDSHQQQENPKWFDLPIRWLQELYPIDDLLAKEFGLNRNKIEFHCDEMSASTYTVAVENRRGEIVKQFHFDTHYGEQPYLQEYPKLGIVHPPTGWLQVTVNDHVLVDMRIRTDVEEIWDIYQNIVLAKCRDHVLSCTNGKPTKESQPFFKELTLEITASEPDFPLGIREDRVSSLDALHEDIYFVGLDFFKTFGEQITGEMLGEPGLILPKIKKSTGTSPAFKVSLSQQAAQSAVAISEQATIFLRQTREWEAAVTNIDFENGSMIGITVDVFAGNAVEDAVHQLLALKEIFAAGVMSSNSLFSKLKPLKTIQICLHGEAKRAATVILEVPAQEVNGRQSQDPVAAAVSQFEITDKRVIGYDEYLKCIHHLSSRPGIQVWQAGTSYLGKEIYAIDVTAPFQAQLVSRTKLIHAKPVYMLINRHHANEVSSTNSALKLAQQMVTDPSCRKYLEKVNLVIIPLENVDGAEIHYELQQQNPTWKLHVARYNAVGREYRWDYWQASKYGESKVVPAVWESWLPDMVVDNHGVPSHEWVQPFAGYVSPWFKGFWLPRALFYGYYWYIDSPDYPEQKNLNHAISDAVAHALNADAEIAWWNEEWRDRFEKYAHQWMPKLFPADYYKNLIYYWIPCKADPQSDRSSHRYPWITAVEWTTEVSDETAQGDYLRLCTKTHYLADLAVIDMLSQVNVQLKDESREDDNEIWLKRRRCRPITLPISGKMCRRG